MTYTYKNACFCKRHGFIPDEKVVLDKNTRPICPSCIELIAEWEKHPPIKYGYKEHKLRYKILPFQLRLKSRDSKTNPPLFTTKEKIQKIKKAQKNKGAKK